MGLADDCYELTILRQYRDNYLRTAPNGSADICEYYHIAPVIVAKIHERADACKVFERIYRELVKPCVKLIEEKRFEDAHRTYKEYTMLLAEEFA